jgi:hypothetical protein
MKCIREVFPGNEIVENRNKTYPIRVRVTAEMGEKKGTEIWSGRQQSLFMKNRKERDQSIAAMVKNLKELKAKIDA